MFDRKSNLDLGDPYGSLSINESLDANTATVGYHVSGDRVDGPIFISPNPHDVHIILSTLKIHLGRIDLRAGTVSQSLKVDNTPVAGVLILNPTEMSIGPIHRQDEDSNLLGIHPVSNEVHDFLAIVLGLLVDRWVRRTDAPALRMTVACQNLIFRYDQERAYYQRAHQQLRELCSDIQSRAEKLDLAEYLAEEKGIRLPG